MKRLPYGRQSIAESDIAAVTAVLKGDWLTGGPAVAAYEEALAATLDTPFAVACSSGTAALHLAYTALGIGPGDRVVVPAMTFTASAAMALCCGAEIVIADVDPDSGLLRPEDLGAALAAAGAPKPKALCLVHLNGQAADVGAIAAIARDQGLAIVEDACHALGSAYRADDGDHKVGACRHSDLACFSFHPVKTITTAEGGAVTTRDPAMAARLRDLRSHGLVRDPSRLRDPAGAGRPWYYEVQSLGFNYRLSDLQCALGINQLRRLPDFVARRRALVARYDERLRPFAPLLRPVSRSSASLSAWHLYPVLFDFGALDQSRAAVMTALAERDIGSQVHYIPLPLHPLYRERVGCPVPPGSQTYYDRVLSLPLYPDLRDEDVDFVVASLVEILALKPAD